MTPAPTTVSTRAHGIHCGNRDLALAVSATVSLDADAWPDALTGATKQ
jgi:hypothetical protein